jgi:hypothetical protein
MPNSAGPASSDACFARAKQAFAWDRSALSGACRATVSLPRAELPACPVDDRATVRSAAAEAGGSGAASGVDAVDRGEYGTELSHRVKAEHSEGNVPKTLTRLVEARRVLSDVVQCRGSLSGRDAQAALYRRARVRNIRRRRTCRDNNGGQTPRDDSQSPHVQSSCCAVDGREPAGARPSTRSEAFCDLLRQIGLDRGCSVAAPGSRVHCGATTNFRVLSPSTRPGERVR